jgi:hypothetical protein
MHVPHQTTTCCHPPTPDEADRNTRTGQGTCKTTALLHSQTFSNKPTYAAPHRACAACTVKGSTMQLAYADALNCWLHNQCKQRHRCMHVHTKVLPLGCAMHTRQHLIHMQGQLLELHQHKRLQVLNDTPHQRTETGSKPGRG